MAQTTKESGERRQLSIRLESLTDMVFGLALSIGALLLAISGVSTAAQLESNIVTFGFSFLILIYVWMRYTAIIADLPQEMKQSRPVLYLSSIVLFMVAVEPYLFNILHTATSNSLLGFASSVYALDIGAIMFVLGILISLLIRYDVKKNKRFTLPIRYLYIRGGCFSIAAVMVISALPLFWHILIFGLEVRFLMWLIIIPLMTITRFVRNARKEGKRT